MTKHLSRQMGAPMPLDPSSLALVMLTSALWGGVPVAISFSVVALPPVAVAAIRFAMAAVFMFFWCRLEGSSIRLRPGDLKPSLITALLLFLQISSFNMGIAWSNSSHASMLINTYVFWVVGIEHFITKADRLTSRKLMGLMVATIGVISVLAVADSDPASPRSGQDTPTAAGDLVLVASALLLAIRIVYMKQALIRIEPSKLIFWHDVFGVILFSIYSLAAEEIVAERITWSAVLGLLYQGFLVAGLCFAIQAMLLRKHSASQISIFSFSTPLFGVLLAVIFRNDPLSRWLLVAAVCVAVGIFLVNSGERR